MSVVGIGNCQVDGIVKCAADALGMTSVYVHPRAAREDREGFRALIAEASIAFASRGSQQVELKAIANEIGRADLPVLAVPRVYFSGFHPDVAYPNTAAAELKGLPMGNAHSAILLAAFRDNLSVQETLSLYRGEVYEALGYFDAYDFSIEALIDECSQCGFDVAPMLPAWLEGGAFVYVPLHPRIEVLDDIARALLRSAGRKELGPPTAVDDELSRNLIWPIYPEIADRIGIAGDYIFRPKNSKAVTRAELAPMDLAAFVERSFAVYRRTPPDFAAFERMADPRFEDIRRFAKQATGSSANPYAAVAPPGWWAKAIAGTPAEEVDPVVSAKFKVSKRDRVATAGSCFAQHIARRLEKAGFNYLVTERAPPGCDDPAASDYGVFTARFGNLYTVRQLLQLAARAYGELDPAIAAWEVQDGYVDPFRPRIAGSPFATLEDLESSRRAHFDAVREMFETADVFVFTLGLTETWAACTDGSVVPLPPGVVGADALADSYVPRNFTTAEVVADLEALVQLFQRRNPRVRILLTVSPVPLIATHQAEHVLTATTYSKSVLRAAAGDVARANAHVEYFPSYELISGSYSRGRYFAEDLRQVTEEGVDHVMRVFMRHYTDSAQQAAGRTRDAERFRLEARAAQEIICDEEEIEQSVARPL